MPNTVAFTGFSAGGAVTIDGVTASTWGVAPSGSTVWDLTPTGGVSVTINQNRTDHQVAPDLLICDLTLTGFDTNTVSNQHDPSYYDKEIFWDWGEDYDFTAPTQVLALDAVDGGQRASARYSRGPVGAHVFRGNGDFTVRVAVIERSSGNVGIASATISVADPDVFYAGDKTLFVDTNGAGGGRPNMPSGAQPFDDIDAAFTSLLADTTPHRIVLERGQTHTVNSAMNFNPPGATADTTLRIQAREDVSGARPIVQSAITNGTLITDASLNGTTGDSGVVLQGIDFVADYDPTDDTGNETILLGMASGARAQSVVTDSISATGFYVGINDTNVGGDQPNKLLGFNDQIVTDWGNIAFFGGQDSKTAFLGCRHAQNVQAGNYIDGGSTLGPARIGRCNILVMKAVDFFQSSGWSELGQDISCQTCLRLFGSPNAAWKKVLITDSVMEGGRLAMYFRPYATSETRYPQLALFEGNFFISGHQAADVMEVAHGGLELRNNVMTRSGPETRALSSFVRFSGGSSSSPALNQNTPVKVYNNSFINRTATVAAETRADGSAAVTFTDLEVENNLLHQPEASSTPFGTVTLTSAITPRYAGYSDDWEYLTSGNITAVPSPSFDATKATPATGGVIPTPTDVLALDAADTLQSVARGGFKATYTNTTAITAADRDVGAVEV